MKNQKNRLYNERPSEVLNIGNDIPDAARHRNDTYETPEQLRTKAFKKQSVKGLKELKAKAAKDLNAENFRQVIQTYEFKRFLMSNESLSSFIFEGEYSKEKSTELRAYIVKNKDMMPDASKVIGGFNRLLNTLHKASYRSWGALQTHFESRKVETFVERNGKTSQWSSDSKLDAQVKYKLESMVNAVQFGNSVPDSERVYCSTELVKALESICTVLSYDFKHLGFSYGARGNAKSVAFYQHSAKVLSFNRHIDGALLHELGHAIDYSLDLVSYKMPSSIKSNYRDKLSKIEGMPYKVRRYFEGNKEIFARLFEQYLAELLGEKCSDFMYSVNDSRVMPELNDESRAWMRETLQSILKGA